MSSVNETRFWVKHINRVTANVDWINLYEIQIKSGIIRNVSVNVKNQMIGVLVKMVVYGNLLHVIVSVIKHVKLMNTFLQKTVLAKNFQFVN